MSFVNNLLRENCLRKIFSYFILVEMSDLGFEQRHLISQNTTDETTATKLILLTEAIKIAAKRKTSYYKNFGKRSIILCLIIMILRRMLM